MGALSKPAGIQKPTRVTRPERRLPERVMLSLQEPSRDAIVSETIRDDRFLNIVLDAVDDWTTYSKWYTGLYNSLRDVRALRRSALNHLMWARILDGKPARFLEAKAQVDFAGELRTIDVGAEPTAILNLGFGNGEWAFDVSRNYPKTRVLGVDLCIPPRIICPPNLSCVAGNFDAPFCSFDRDHLGKYSLIHIRSAVQSVQNLGRFFEQCRDSLVPGGRIEIHEFGRVTADDGSLAGTAMEEVQHRQQEAAWRESRRGGGGGSSSGSVSDHLRPGAPPAAGDPLPGLGAALVRAGFEDVVVARTRCPVNPEAVAPGRADAELGERDRLEREVAKLYRRQFDEGRLLEAQCKGLLMKGLGWSEGMVDNLFRRVRRELRDPRIRAYSPAYVVSARRPLDASLGKEGEERGVDNCQCVPRSRYSKLFLERLRED